MRWQVLEPRREAPHSLRCAFSFLCPARRKTDLNLDPCRGCLFLSKDNELHIECKKVQRCHFLIELQHFTSATTTDFSEAPCQVPPARRQHPLAAVARERVGTATIPPSEPLSSKTVLSTLERAFNLETGITARVLARTGDLFTESHISTGNVLITLVRHCRTSTLQIRENCICP